jgi:signal transduction histidine kinase
VFIALTGGTIPLLSNLARVPALDIAPRPRPVMVHLGPDIPDIEGMAIAGQLPDGDRLIVGVMGATESRFNLAFATAAGLTILVAVALATASALLLGLEISRRTHAIAETAAQFALGNFGARLPESRSGDGFDHLRLQMNRMAERIDRLVSELGSVSASLAHDLRSPVARLSAAIDTALDKVEEPAAIEALQAARENADGLRRMLDTALEITRLEGGAVADRRLPIDLARVAEDMAELYEPLAEQSGVRFETRLEPVVVIADRELLSRAIANLIDNALKFGAQRVVLSTSAAHATGPGLSPGAAMAEIAVLDDGPGIAPADRDRAIERFVRLDNARTLPGGGLGLAMVQAVARLHGGELSLSDGRGPGNRGLLATLRLPR